MEPLLANLCHRLKLLLPGLGAKRNLPMEIPTEVRLWPRQIDSKAQLLESAPIQLFEHEEVKLVPTLNLYFYVVSLVMKGPL